MKKQMEVYKERVERTPQVEMVLTKLTRDHETTQARYQDLLSKKLDAEMASRLDEGWSARRPRVDVPQLPLAGRLYNRRLSVRDRCGREP
mgnify:CR=1 FL=1